MTTRILIGDCIEQMRGLPDCSVDAVVTDPPYGLGFMGVKWDTYGDGKGQGPKKKVKFDQVGGNSHARKPGGVELIRGKENRKFQEAATEWFAEALRVAKPGAHLLSFGGSRTYHRMACAIEDAGWEIRDQIMWVYASGFPKSLNVGRAVDKLQGNERENVGVQTTNVGMQGNNFKNKSQSGEVIVTRGDSEWEGFGTALKPAHEPICLARKPLTGTVAENVLKHGCGALNIDGCRIGTEKRTYNGGGASHIKLSNHSKGDTGIGYMDGSGKDREYSATGRWPANFCHDGSKEVLQLFPDRNAGGSRTGNEPSDKTKNCYGEYGQIGFHSHNDTGSAARFFFCAKASKYDRDHGLEGTSKYLCGMMEDDEYPIKTGSGNLRETKRHNHHPTVKPHNLMRWLCRLITPPGGTILDPFMGSGSTGKAAIREGFSFIGIDLDPEYAEIARKRIEAVKYVPKAKVLPRYQGKEEVRRKPEQLELFQMEAN